MTDTVDTLIVGAGLTGLSLARKLAVAGRTVHVIEARSRPGGRIKSNNGLDLGPAWFWPGQHRIETLIREFELTTFEQFTDGDMIVEFQQGLQRGRAMSGMAGSYRVDGGLSRLIESLAASLPSGSITYDAEATRITETEAAVSLTCLDGRAFSGQRLVLAVPPRLAAGLGFEPALPNECVSNLSSIPTWMAGQAKAIATYTKPFWRTAGLSGDAMSQIGPMIEIHDASSVDGPPYALFGFLGIAPSARRNLTELENAVRDQFTRLFGQGASDPLSLQIMDWAFETYTATDVDHAPVAQHPTYGRPESLGAQWSGKLYFAASELGSDAGGFLEGALACAEDIAKELT